MEKMNEKSDGPDEELPEIDLISDYYNRGRFRRGTAIIFNHYEFDGFMNSRKGTIKDGEDLEEVLKDLKFNVTTYSDLDYAEIYDVLTNLSKADHSDVDCLLVAVLTHGDVGRIYARDHQYPSDLLWLPFTENECSTLVGKPKLFFIQACRGDNVDGGVKVRAINADSENTNLTIPVMADILVMYSTFSGYYSWRSPGTGSWFIQCLCQELKQRANKDDLVTILTFLNRRMAFYYKSYVPKDKDMHKKKQIGTIISTLTRLLYFDPPVDFT